MLEQYFIKPATIDRLRGSWIAAEIETYVELVTDLAFPVPDGVSPPVLHCLRHSFAVGCLLRWYRQGADPLQQLFRLSTFMGHVDPVSTAVYLTITPQLLAEAGRRFEAFAQPTWTQDR
jgi:integrase